MFITKETMRKRRAIVRHHRIENAVEGLTRKQHAALNDLVSKMQDRPRPEDVDGIIWEVDFGRRVDELEKQTGLYQFEILTLLHHFKDRPEEEMLEFAARYKEMSEYALEVFARPKTYLVPFMNAMIEEDEKAKLDDATRKAYGKIVFMGDREEGHDSHDIELSTKGVKDRKERQAQEDATRKQRQDDETEGRWARERRERERKEAQERLKREKEESANE